MSPAAAPSPAPLPPPPRRAAPVRAGLGLLWPLALVLLLVLAVAAALAFAARWVLLTEAGTLWLLQRAPMVQVQGWQGALLGDRWQAERLRVQWDGGQQWVVLEQLKAEALTWRWRPDAHLWLALDVGQLQARRVQLETGPPGPRPIPLPAHLAPPLRLSVARAEIGEFKFEPLQPATDLVATDLRLDGTPGSGHRIGAFTAAAYGIRVAGRATLANARPFDLRAEATLAPAQGVADAPAWGAVARANGPLAAFDLRTTLRGRPLVASATQGPALDLEALVQPLQAWPVQKLKASTESLDLASIWTGGPQTRLAGELQIQAADRQAPVQAQLRLQNRSPGRWNERRAPLSRLELDLRGLLAQPDRLELTRFEVQLADAAGPAGQASGHAVWQRHGLDGEIKLADLRPHRLDSRAPVMVLNGPLQIGAQGLPSPAPKTGESPPPWSLQTRLQLEGRVEGAPQAVSVRAEAVANAGGLELQHLQARAGEAQAVARASLQRAANGDLRLVSAGSLDDFDPMPWWPGDAGTPWRRGPHRLSAGWDFDLALPAQARKLAPLALLQSLAGNGHLRLHDSVLAGVPLSGEVRLAYNRQAAIAPGTLRMDLALGGNRVQLQGQGDPAGSGAGDDWRLQVQAAQLSTLAPLTRLHPALADWVPRQGSIEADLAAQGRWPRLTSSGQAGIDQLQAGRLSLQRAAATWQVDLTERADQGTPLAVQLEASDLRLGEQRLQQLAFSLRGTQAAHRLELSASLPATPGAAVQTVLGIAGQEATRARLLAQGEWLPETAGGGRWRARVEQLEVSPAGADSAAPAARWAEARDLRAELQFDAGGQLATVRADPGRLRLADAYAVRWDAVLIDLRRGSADFELRADLEPFALPPLLARLQPQIGWTGDLRLAGSVSVRAAERFEADISFQRHDGDLHLLSGGELQLLGLTEFRLALRARDGQWDFEPAFNGRSLGEIRGRVRAQTTPQRRWPDEQAPIEGSLTARVPDIGIWGHLVPAGWRLAGELRTTLALGGRFGDPTYTGELTGQGLGVRNLLQGVNVSGGRLRVRLAGDSAQIETFTLRGGDGQVEVTGNAALGRNPSARLQLKAERFRVLGRVDRMLSASGSAELELTPDSSRLDGRFRVDEGLFDFSRADAPGLDDDVSLVGAEEPGAARADPAAARPRRTFALGVDVNLGENLRVRGRGLEAGLSGEVRITNPGGRLAVNGRIQTEGGTYAAYGQKLELDHGILTFNGPPDNPRLDVLALRPNLDNIRVGVQVSGALQSMRVRLFSDPELPETDKLSWLVLGRASDGLGRNDTALLQRAAVALLAGEGEAPTDQLMKTLGIDEFSLRQSEGDVRETVVSFGKQLSRRWYLGYERGVNATAGTWQLIYRAAQRFTVRAQSGMENSLDLIWTWRFQEPPAEGGVRKSVPVARP